MYSTFTRAGWSFALLCFLIIFPIALIPSRTSAQEVTLLRTPNGGIQPQAAIDNHGVLHLIYYKGDPAHGDIFYVHKKLGQAYPFSRPIRVNSQPGSAVATGTIRGAQLAIGKGDRVFVAWNGSQNATKGPGGTPMLFSYLNANGSAFAPQRDLITWAGGIDGGGSVAADPMGHVYVTWHASKQGTDEAAGGVYMTRSMDNGRTFERERKISVYPTGQCGCCSMRAFADTTGSLYILYRAAGENRHRDTTLLASHDQGTSFQQAIMQRWDLMACPMSSFSLASSNRGILGAWETANQVYFGLLRTGSIVAAAPAGNGQRKYPVVVSNKAGQTLLAWVDGAGWERGGTLKWQVFGSNGAPLAGQGSAPGVPVWSLETAVCRPDGSFAIIY